MIMICDSMSVERLWNLFLPLCRVASNSNTLLL